MSASSLLRQTRRARTLTQRALAQLAGVVQPVVADIERGGRDPSVGTLERLLRPTGHRLIAIPTWAASASETADEIRESLRENRPERALRLLIALSDGLVEQTPDIRVALCVTPPGLCGDPRFDAAIAAVVDHHLRSHRLPVPAWVSDPSRVLADRWTVDLFADDSVVDETPIAFRRHGVLLALRELESV